MNKDLPSIDFAKRRDKALDLVAGGALLVTSPPMAHQLVKTFRQDSFLHYLTGFLEPDTALLLVNTKYSGRASFLFVREKDPAIELWEGRRLGVTDARRKFPVTDVFPIHKLWDLLPTLVESCDFISYHLGEDKDRDAEFIHMLQAVKKKKGRTTSSLLTVRDSHEVSGQLRLWKQPEEVARMRHAASITREGFQYVYKNLRPGMNEREVHGMLLKEFYRNGADMEAYGSIVAGGHNATVLHYGENSQPLRDGDVLLIDAGCQFDYYASDVTRTFPVGKAFTSEQKQIYQAVLNAQLKCIDFAKPGNTLDAMHDLAIASLTESLCQIGLIQEKPQDAIASGYFKRFYPHRTSHWIGCDVHDVGDYHVNGKPRALEPGMYFSVEPGIYIDPQDETVPAGFRGIGVRIEDDVLVTANGNEVITGAIAKNVSDLENRW